MEIKSMFIYIVQATLYLKLVSSVEHICEICECRKQNSIVDCSNRSLPGIPPGIPQPTKILMLCSNKIDFIPDFIFNGTNLITLDLSYNRIRSLSLNSLYGLYELQMLSLQNNLIYMEERNYPSGVFKHLKNLKILDISSNLIPLKLNISYPDGTFSDLGLLEDLNMDGIPELQLLEGFIKLSHLKYLNFTGNCKTTKIFDSTFQYVPNLQVLILSKCRLQHIGNGALQMFHNLAYLDMSYNRKLGFEAATLPLKLLGSSNFNIIDLSAIEEIFGLGVLLTGNQFSRMKHLNITHLFIGHNRIELLEPTVMLQLPPQVKVLGFRDNRPTFGYYLLYTAALGELISGDISQQHKSHSPSINMDDTTRISPSSEIFIQRSVLENAYLSQTLKYLADTASGHAIQQISSRSEIYWDQQIKCKIITDRFAQSNDRTHSVALRSMLPKTNKFVYDFLIQLPPKIEFINVSGSNLNFPIPQLHFDSNNAKCLDLSQNTFHSWKGPVFGISGLEWLDISNNYCDFISTEFFNYFENLRYLRISSNFLAAIFEGDTAGDIFHNLTKLEILDISDNKIRSISPKLLRGQHQLRQLRMSKNPMKTWTLDISNMSDLEYVDLSYNLLSGLPSDFRQFCVNQHKNNKTVTVNLQGQILQCTCDNLNFLVWMNQDLVRFINKDTYKCANKNGEEQSIRDLNEIIMYLQKQCASYIELTVVLICSIISFTTIIIGSLIYRYRWKLRYLYYLTRSRYKGYSAIGGAALNTFDYDAFVSYADEDRRLVVQNMIKKLEQEHGMQLCIHHRDFLVGEEIAANILNAVRNSKKTLIVLSKHFLASYWCIYELNMAHIESLETGRNVLIVIVYEHIPIRQLPPILVQLMKNDSYIEYTEDPEGNIVFWDKLKRAISAD